jgi:hypothetical protein
VFSFREVKTLVFRPPEPTDGRFLRVIASPGVARSAGRNGLLTLDFQDVQVPARVVAVATRFPTVDSDQQFVVVDETHLATALDANAPGTGMPGELWLSVPGDAAGNAANVLSRPPFSALAQASRRHLLRQIEDDPLARAIGYILGAAAIIALVLAAIGLLVTLVSELRDERGDLFDLESQGVPPETLRWHSRFRAFALIVFGIFGGTLLAFVLSRLVVSLILVSAETSSPEPPLIFDPSWSAIALTLAALLLVTALAAEVSLRSAFRGEVPARGQWSPE